MTVALEVNPASDWCQRWNGRSHSWRHKSEGGFNPDDYTVEAIAGDETAETYVLEHHYSGTYPCAKYRYGLYRDERLVGVMVLGIPTQSKVLTNVFPDLEPYVESLDLSRFVLNDEVPGNGESWFIGQAFRQAAEKGVRGIVSFADPCPRRIGGRLLFPGHRGTIYMASNARYTGRATARTLLLLPDGTVLNARSQQKVRKQERGHRAVEQTLTQLGARTIRAGEKPSEWLADALTSIGVTRIRHRGNFRYAFRIGSPTQRRRVRIALDHQPYPKKIDG